MSQPAIRANGLSKQYQIGAGPGAYRTLREAIVEWASAPLRGFGQASQPDPIWALRDASFEIHQGEVVGVVGRNGAGKSTLLKVLARITEPTHGRAELRGRIASLLEVGTGFHPELTGRENVQLSGAILGMSRQEIREKFDQIVAFSGVERFVDTPVKRYSSGMYVRLAFAVAAHLEAQILLVDEVLAVGDIAFQKQCIGKMKDIAGQGRTVLFVSHNLSAVSNLCTRALWLHDGTVKADGSVAEILSLYRNEVGSATGVARGGATGLRVEALRVLRSDSSPGDGSYEPFDGCLVEAEFETTRRLDPLEVNLTVQDADGRVAIHLRSDFDGCYPVFEPGRHRLAVDLESLNLESQIYFLWLRLVAREPLVIADSEPVPLEVRASWDRHENMRPVVAVRHRWRLEAR
jgi:ABC-type polysaccharide/polyol phosphate transport system ATPase subunit